MKRFPVGTMANFVYLLMDPGSKEAMVVDSGWETAAIVRAAEEASAKVKFAVATHEHFDHTSTLAELAGQLGAKVVAHENSPVEHDVTVVDGQELRLGRRAVKVLHTPGHTEDSICLYDGRNLFTGDTLFIGTIGKFEREAAQTMYDSLHGVIMKLPDSTMIYPGHDYGEVPSRTLGEERAANPFLLTRDLRSFLSFFA
ncbi:MAG TPA: MBL fold metallo-hydrolase [Nitrososphaerales archaeon]|nr:MBL fold metallo-hydrolase [Nitrososphaerales archaeon]